MVGKVEKMQGKIIENARENEDIVEIREIEQSKNVKIVGTFHEKEVSIYFIFEVVENQYETIDYEV